MESKKQRGPKNNAKKLKDKSDARYSIQRNVGWALAHLKRNWWGKPHPTESRCYILDIRNNPVANYKHPESKIEVRVQVS